LGADSVSDAAPIWLTPAEVEELTACKRRDVQCKRLAAMQIPFRPNYAGRPLVERYARDAHLQRVNAASRPESPGLSALRKIWAAGRERARTALDHPAIVEYNAEILRREASARRAESKRNHALRLTGACPAWVDRCEIEAIYANAAARTRDTGTPYEVDHEVPLQGAHVCGLHVPWNLRVITRLQNRSKGNRLCA
jgi:hypothetical protein